MAMQCYVKQPVGTRSLFSVQEGQSSVDIAVVPVLLYRSACQTER